MTNLPNPRHNPVAPAAPAGSAVEGNPGSFNWRTEPCGECNGAGFTLEARRYSGEFYGECVEVPCHACERGEIDAACAGCDHIAPLNDDMLCERCSALVEVEWLGNGRLVA